jgi:ketosteroid isomerase-like protein
MRHYHHVRSSVLVSATVVATVVLAATLGAQSGGAGAAGAGSSTTDPAAPAGSLSAIDSAEVAGTVGRYHAALGRGDSTAALALLAPDAVILESGGRESVAEYRAHHLPADIEFARGVPETRSPIRVIVRGDAAWATSTTTTKGTFRGRAVDSVGAELMVLTRTADGWRIAAIHWSSRRRG